MFRDMRRFKQQLSEDECIKILSEQTSGVLAVSGDDDYPYTVPMSYIYHDNKLYFHSALSGHKLDAINKNPKVSFCVVAKDEIVSEKFTTLYKSVVVFGKMHIIDNAEDKLSTLKLLTEKYSPNMDTQRDKEIGGSFNRLVMLRLDIEHMTGKQSIELVNRQ